jgi:hypothetical protein
MPRPRDNPKRIVILTTPEYRGWLDAVRAELGLDSDAALWDAAIKSLVTYWGWNPPPRRSRPIGTNRHGEPKKEEP